MKTRWWRNEFTVGLIVIVGVALLSVLLIRASQWKLDLNTKEVRIHFNYVGGLLKGAPVNMYGMEVGKVKSVDLMGDWVLVTVQIDEKISIREGYQILIDVIGIVGEKYVEIINGPLKSPVTNDDPLVGINPASVGHVLMKAGEISDKTIRTLDFIQDIIDVNEAQIRAGVSELKVSVAEAKESINRTMDNLDILLTRANKMTEGKEGDIGQIITNLKVLVEELNNDRKEIVPQIQTVASDLDKLLNRTTPQIEGSLGNLQKASEDLKDSGEKVNRYVEELNESLSQLIKQISDIADSSDTKLQASLDDFSKLSAELGKVLDRIDKLITEIEEGRGTVGKLVKDEDSYNQLSETIAAGKRAVESVQDVTNNLNNKLRFFDGINAKGRYELSYNSLSQSLRNQIALSVDRSGSNFLATGISVRENDLTYDLQLGRKFGSLVARAGSIRSKAGIGFDYWAFSDRLGLSLEGLNITDRHPELDFNASVKMFGNWYFIFGADNLTGSEIGFNFGLRTVY